MTLRIIYPAYQPMDSIFSPESLCSAMSPFHPMLRKRRRIMNLENLDRIFNNTLLPSYDLCEKRKCSNKDSENTAEEEKSSVFTKKMKLKDFKPSDIQIRVTADKKVVVEAKQEVKEENEGFHSYQLREFKQSLDVPENVNIEELTSSFNENGELTISAPLLSLPEPEKDEENEVSKLPVTFEKEEESKRDNGVCSTKDDEDKPSTSSN